MICFYSTGGYAPLIKKLIHKMESEVECCAIATNWQGMKCLTGSVQNRRLLYIYEEFNSVYEVSNHDHDRNSWPDIHIARILAVDKKFFKLENNLFQERYVFSILSILKKFVDDMRIEFMYFPSLETVDSMAAYELCRSTGIKTINPVDVRFADRTYLSPGYDETLPSYSAIYQASSSDETISPDVYVDHFLKTGRIRLRTLGQDACASSSLKKRSARKSIIKMLITNLYYMYTIEKHNKRSKVYVKLFVYFGQQVAALRRYYYKLIERLIIKAVDFDELSVGPNGYDLYLLHFSPESSINVPSPYYIDQQRTIDRILLDSCRMNRLLLIKEHPAMYGNRAISEYSKFNKTPLVRIVKTNNSSLDLIKNCHHLYTVTGTASLEAFFLGKKFTIYGMNLLSNWMDSMRNKYDQLSPQRFIGDLVRVSGEYVVYSPGSSLKRDIILLGKTNIERHAHHLLFHMREYRS